ncbi:MAG: hypothetical protein K0Q90_2074 [Paenibacillaceae bacterium]|jgi:DNA-binding transcriptional MerR regulator|nr:hypothetical protein [Paenibacillaceae bacterium]
MGKLYNQLEVIKALRVSPTTVKRWIHYFSEFIPTVRQGDAVMYEAGTLKLLRRVRTLRNNRFSLKSILNLLEEEGFEGISTHPLHPDENTPIPVVRPVRPKRPVHPTKRSEAETEALQTLIQSFHAVSREFAQIAQQIDKLVNES